MLNFSKVSPRPRITWRPTVLFWIVAAIVFLLVLLFAAVGGFGAVLVILGIVALVTGLYALLFKRRSWVGLPHRKSALLVAASGIALFLVGGIVAGATASSTGSQNKAALVAASASASATPTATPTATNPTKTACLTAGEKKTYNNDVLICTMGADQRLVWLPEAESKVIVAKAAADKLAAEKAAADKVAADKAAADKVAADKAAADKAAADKAAADKAAAAAQQAAKNVPVAPVAPPVPAAAYYANCTEARAAGAAPIYRGSPGYRSPLDRDGDGIACDK